MRLSSKCKITLTVVVISILFIKLCDAQQKNVKARQSSPGGGNSRNSGGFTNNKGNEGNGRSKESKNIDRSDADANTRMGNHDKRNNDSPMGGGRNEEPSRRKGNMGGANDELPMKKGNMGGVKNEPLAPVKKGKQMGGGRNDDSPMMKGNMGGGGRNEESSKRNKNMGRANDEPPMKRRKMGGLSNEPPIKKGNQMGGGRNDEPPMRMGNTGGENRIEEHEKRNKGNIGGVHDVEVGGRSEKVSVNKGNTGVNEKPPMKLGKMSVGGRNDEPPMRKGNMGGGERIEEPPMKKGNMAGVKNEPPMRMGNMGGGERNEKPPIKKGNTDLRGPIDEPHFKRGYIGVGGPMDEPPKKVEIKQVANMGGGRQIDVTSLKKGNVDFGGAMDKPINIMTDHIEPNKKDGSVGRRNDEPFKNIIAEPLLNVAIDPFIKSSDMPRETIAESLMAVNPEANQNNVNAALMSSDVPLGLPYRVSSIDESSGKISSPNNFPSNQESKPIGLPATSSPSLESWGSPSRTHDTNHLPKYDWNSQNIPDILSEKPERNKNREHSITNDNDVMHNYRFNGDEDKGGLQAHKVSLKSGQHYKNEKEDSDATGFVYETGVNTDYNYASSENQDYDYDTELENNHDNLNSEYYQTDDDYTNYNIDYPANNAQYAYNTKDDNSEYHQQNNQFEEAKKQFEQARVASDDPSSSNEDADFYSFSKFKGTVTSWLGGSSGSSRWIATETQYYCWITIAIISFSVMQQTT